MTKLTNTVAAAAIAAITASSAFAQDTTAPAEPVVGDPFTGGTVIQSTSTGLTAAALGGATLLLVGAIVVVLDSDGNVVSTTATP